MDLKGDSYKYIRTRAQPHECTPHGFYSGKTRVASTDSMVQRFPKALTACIRGTRAQLYATHMLQTCVLKTTAARKTLASAKAGSSPSDGCSRS